jgi:hypothetical protein
MSRSRLLAVALLTPMLALASPDAVPDRKEGGGTAPGAPASTATAARAQGKEPGSPQGAAAWTWAPWRADARTETRPPLPPQEGC